MFEIKKCTCGESSFAILVDEFTYVACTKCGLLVLDKDIASLPYERMNATFQLVSA